MANLLFVLVLTVLSISAFTEAQFFFQCPPNCHDTECSSMGCVTCDPGYCRYYSTSSKIGICVLACPTGMHCYHGVLSVCTMGEDDVSAVVRLRSQKHMPLVDVWNVDLILYDLNR